jgi:tetrahydromethanopterin S-methyltransferase subunit F
MAATRHDNFLSDITQPRKQRLGYFDGFRFGLGFFTAGLLIGLILSVLTTGIILLLHVH